MAVTTRGATPSSVGGAGAAAPPELLGAAGAGGRPLGIGSLPGGGGGGIPAGAGGGASLAPLPYPSWAKDFKTINYHMRNM